MQSLSPDTILSRRYLEISYQFFIAGTICAGVGVGIDSAGVVSESTLELLVGVVSEPEIDSAGGFQNLPWNYVEVVFLNALFQQTIMFSV